MTIEENRYFCQTHGMKMASIKNRLENNLLKLYANPILRLGAIWNQTKHSFEWEDGNDINYNNWITQPVCLECCTVGIISNGSWILRNCKGGLQGQIMALCEYDGENIPNAINSLNSSIISLNEKINTHTINDLVSQKVKEINGKEYPSYENEIKIESMKKDIVNQIEQKLNRSNPGSETIDQLQLLILHNEKSINDLRKMICVMIALVPITFILVKFSYKYFHEKEYNFNQPFSFNSLKRGSKKYGTSNSNTILVEHEIKL